MDINFNCTNCGTPLAATTLDIGSDVRCPVCATALSLKPPVRQRVVGNTSPPFVSDSGIKSAHEPSADSSGSRGEHANPRLSGRVDVQIGGGSPGLNNVDSVERRKPNGVNGWLLFFIATLVVVSPIRNIYSFSTAYTELLPVFDAVYLLKFALQLYTLTFVALLIYQLTAAYKLVYRKHQAIHYTKRMLLLVAIISSVANILWMLFLEALPQIEKSYLHPFIAEQVKTVLANCFYAFIWTRYLNTSDRVRNTYSE